MTIPTTTTSAPVVPVDGKILFLVSLSSLFGGIVVSPEGFGSVDCVGVVLPFF